MAAPLSGVVIGVVALMLASCSSVDDLAGPAVTTDAASTVAPSSVIDDPSPASDSAARPSAATVATPAPTDATPAPTDATPAPTDATPAPTDLAPAGDATTSPSCEFAGGFDEVQYEFPMVMSGEVGSDIRTGPHPCFERVVIELEVRDADLAPVVPGYWVRYASGPLTLGQTDDQFVELAGDADLLITVNAWMTAIEGDGQLVGYDGPTDIVPSNVTVIKQLRLLDNFEGVHTWAVGLDHQRAFHVVTLADPTRIVVDISY